MDGDVLLCARCDYDLRTLDPAGVCPECATPIAESVEAAADPLRVARRRLRPAAIALVAGSVLRIALALAVAMYHISLGSVDFISYATAILLNPWPLEEFLSVFSEIRRTNLLMAFLLSWFALSLLVECIGIWLLTRDMRPAVDLRLLRLATRWTIALALTLGLMLLWPTTRSMVGFLSYVPFTIGAVIGPPLLIAIWSGCVWWRVSKRTPLDSGWPSIVICFSVLAALMNRARSWMGSNGLLAAVVSAAAFLLLSKLWFDLLRLTRTGPAPAAPRQTAATMP